MRCRIEAGGRLREVSVLAEGRTFAVAVDGRVRRVDAARIDGQTLSLIVDSSVPGRRVVYETVTASSSAGGPVVVHVGSVPVSVTVDSRRPRNRAESRSGSGPQRIVAPMPGKVVQVLVEPGQSVRARQPIVVIEAMKMENALRAERDGTVTDVLVRPGTSVEAGALLVQIQ